PSNLSERFIQFIDKCLDEYNTIGNYYYAPYTTLIQASGVGKSKLLINVAEEIMSVYCCLRKSESSGYPPRSDIAKMLIKEFNNEQDAKTTYLAYICACFQKMQDFSGDCKKWLDEHTNKNLQGNFWRDVENRMKNIKDHLMTCSTDSETTDLVEKYLVKKNTVIKREGPVKYLFAFDEASTLVGNKDGSKNVGKISPFYYIRRALILLPKGAGIFAVFTDTHSNISTFSPAYYLDPSKRVAEEKFKLFAPFYLLDTTDMNVNLREVKTLKESEDPRHFFQYGRPLWGMESERIIELAMDKLIGGKYFGVWREEVQIKILDTLAILGP
ncbi:17293_t:CDS:2, partial [Dentiscutata heterogama]